MKGLLELADAINGLRKELPLQLSEIARALKTGEGVDGRRRTRMTHQEPVAAAVANAGHTMQIAGRYGLPAIGVTLIADGDATALEWAANGEQPWTCLEGDSLDQETISTFFIKTTGATGMVRLRFAFADK